MGGGEGDRSADPRETALPRGDVTFLLTDIQGSTARFREIGEQRYRSVLAAHHRLIRAALTAHGGAEVKTEGDAFLAAFPDPDRAVAAALMAQAELAGHDWSPEQPIEVRMGLHRGPAETAEGRDYVAFTLHQAARVASVPHGGQVVCTADVCAHLPAHGDTTVVPLGSYWLKDFTEPAPLFELRRPDDARTSPPLRAARADLSNLPALRGALIGRDAEVADLHEAVSRPGLVTLVGPGGVGKTRLALEVAARAAQAGHAAWLVELAPVDGSGSVAETAVVSATARALGIAGETLAAVNAHVAATPMLLVLDNTEHVIDAAAGLADALLRDSPDLTLLVTSREPLLLDDETVVRLGPLETPVASASVPEIAAYASVRLFVSRAQASARGFALTEDNTHDVAALCHELDGLPLALELAAARAGSLGPRDLLRRVREVGDLPGAARRGKDSRHSTLRAVLEWSLSLCSETELAVLRRLGAFAGAADVDACIAVAGGDGLSAGEVVDALTSLVDKSIVTARTGEVTGYDLLVTVRRVALSRLMDSGEHDEALLRHAEWVLANVRRAAPHLRERDIAAILALQPEAHCALDRGAAGAIPLDVYIELFVALREHLGHRVPTTGVRYGSSLADADLTPTQRAAVLNTTATAMSTLDHPDLAEVERRALAAARAANDPFLLACALCRIGGPANGPRSAGQASGQDAAALAEARDLLPVLATDPRRGDIVVCNQLGIDAFYRDDLDAARTWYLRSRDIALEINHTPNLGIIAYNLAELDELAGDLDAAAAGCAEAAAIFTAGGQLVAGSMSYLQVAELHSRRGRATEAAEAAAEAAVCARRSGAHQHLVRALLAEARALLTLGEDDGAMRLLADANSYDVPSAVEVRTLLAELSRTARASAATA